MLPILVSTKVAAASCREDAILLSFVVWPPVEGMPKSVCDHFGGSPITAVTGKWSEGYLPPSS